MPDNTSNNEPDDEGSIGQPSLRTCSDASDNDEDSATDMDYGAYCLYCHRIYCDCRYRPLFAQSNVIREQVSELCVASCTTTQTGTEWSLLVDGGSTCHVVTGPQYCCDIIDKHVDIQVGNRQICPSTQSGKCVLVHQGKIVVLNDVRIAVGFLHNILSENQVLTQGACIVKRGSTMKAFSPKDKLIFSAARKTGNGLFFLESSHLCQGTTLDDQVRDGQRFLAANTLHRDTALCSEHNGPFAEHNGPLFEALQPYEETTMKPAHLLPNTADSKQREESKRSNDSSQNVTTYCMQHGLDLAAMDGMDRLLAESPSTSITQASELVFEAAARVFQDQEDTLSSILLGVTDLD